MNSTCASLVRPSRLALRLSTLFLTCAAMMGVHSVAWAQQYPDRPIRIVNTFPAGGSGDAVVRIVM
jgi:tripartite-type tricarboxylate transporter receptor subunit TctC